VAVLKGISKHVLEAEAAQPGGVPRGVIDHEFIDAHTTGFAAFRDAVMAEPWDLIETQSGVGRAQIRRAAEIYMRAERVIACWAMGITQHRNAVANVQEIVNLLLLRGNLGRPGAGA